RLLAASLTVVVRPAVPVTGVPLGLGCAGGWRGGGRGGRAGPPPLDQVRLSALQRVWRPHVATDAEARRAALLPYLLAVGATVLVPPVGAEELRDVVEMLLPLVPEESITAAD
ncbi:hypothetical protein ACFY3V_39075, partial [Streptosporangium sp. NPDC000095]|uniref:hypothetical protein n=1 Tax=Streptosporangium sp. NPDC000095 TaxID=3366184 RepID=UPI0036ACFC91